MITKIMLIIAKYSMITDYCGIRKFQNLVLLVNISEEEKEAERMFNLFIEKIDT